MRPIEHGTIHAYDKHRCRCDDCRVVASAAREERRTRAKAGLPKRNATRRSVAERLAEKWQLNAETGCHEWTGSLNNWGYASFSVEGQSRPAHRVAWELNRGPVPDGLDLDHLCRVRHCVNPAHLEPVTRAENNRRKLAATGPGKGKPVGVPDHTTNADRVAARPAS